MFSQPTSTTLLDALRDPALRDKAGARFVEIYTDSLLAATRRYRLQESDAENVVQTVILRVLDGKYERRPGRQFRAWLRTVTRNECLQVLRRERDRKQLVGGTLPEIPDEHETPEFEADEEAKFLASAITHLGRSGVESGAFTEPTWRAFWEWAVNSRPTAEVAGELGIKPGSVHVAVCRVRAWVEPRLRELLD